LGKLYQIMSKDASSLRGGEADEAIQFWIAAPLRGSR
jgi:hypothetical protein